MASHLGQQHAAIPTSSSAPNPLRPYYVPAVGDLSVGGAMDPLASVGDAGSHVQQRSSRASFGSAARDMLADIEYGDYLPDAAPSVGDVAKKLMDQATWKFASVFLAQPFEVAKLTLQCHLAAPAASRGKTLLTPRRRSAAGQRRARAVEVRTLH